VTEIRSLFGFACCHPAPVDSAKSSPPLSLATKQAVSDAIPLFIPAFPFGFVLGLAITESPMPNAVGFLSSLVIMAGAAQLALVTLVGTASVFAAMAAAIVINARHLMYSAALAPLFKAQPRWFRWLGPVMLIDQVFALSMQHAEDEPDYFRRYYMVTASIFFIGWQFVTILGMAFGSFVPESWQLGYAPAVMFTGLVIFGLADRPGVVAAVVGAMVCFATIGLPNRVGLLIGAMCGVAAGYAAETIAERRTVAEAVA